MSSNNTDGLRKLLPSIRAADAPTASGPPARSRTDPPALEEQHHEKSHLHRRLHSNSLRNRAFTGSHHHHHRHSAKETVQSAIELKPPISFDSLLRRDKKNPDSSRHTSHNVLHQQQTQQQRDEGEVGAEQAQRAKRLQAKPEDVKRMREANVRRKNELRESLRNVEEVAMNSTRQLDDTYYTILEKASLLRSTVASLQSLAEKSRLMHTTFQEQTSKLEGDTKDNLGGFENFNAQDKAINALVDQLKRSMEQRSRLDQRLEAARNRVEAYEKREKERNKNRRMRWSVVWAVLLALAILFVVLFAAKNRSAIGSNVPSVAKVFEIASSMTALNPIPRASEDPYLQKLFDEL